MLIIACFPLLSIIDSVFLTELTCLSVIFLLVLIRMANEAKEVVNQVDSDLYRDTLIEKLWKGKPTFGCFACLYRVSLVFSFRMMFSWSLFARHIALSAFLCAFDLFPWD